MKITLSGDGGKKKVPSLAISFLEGPCQKKTNKHTLYHLWLYRNSSFGSVSFLYQEVVDTSSAKAAAHCKLPKPACLSHSQKVGGEDWYFLKAILDPPEEAAQAQDCNTSKFFILIVSRMRRLAGHMWGFSGEDTSMRHWLYQGRLTKWCFTGFN